MSVPIYLVHVLSSIGPELVLSVADFQTIGEVKDMIAAEGGVPASLDELFLGTTPTGVPLDDEVVLLDLEVSDDTVFYVNVRSGVVAYSMTSAATPVPSGAQLAYLRDGAVLSQKVNGIVAGSTYQLAFYALGSVRWTVEFLDASDGVIVAPSNDVNGTDPDLSPFADTVVALGNSFAANLLFEATGSAVLLDLVSFTEA